MWRSSSREQRPSPFIKRGVPTDSLLRSAEHEQILFLYSEFTCRIMSIKAGPAENLWCNLYLPVSVQHPVLFNSIAAMTLFHLACYSRLGDNSTRLQSRAYAYMNSCILELASSILKMANSAPCDFPGDVALATFLNLAVTESWDRTIFSGLAHLKGAKSMVQKVLGADRMCLAADSANPAACAVLGKKLAFARPDEWVAMR